MAVAKMYQAIFHQHNPAFNKPLQDWKKEVPVLK